MRHLTLGALIGMAAGFVLTVLSRAGTVSVTDVHDVAWGDDERLAELVRKNLMSDENPNLNIA